jgi:NAD(P)-dependent dehydrogenase (short-subunit alcohol dehydrogenase family)
MNSGGSIINITSLAVEQGFSDNVAYVAPKGGLKQLTKAMTVDLATKNIRVNSVGPGYVKTKMTEKSWLDKKK